MFFRLAAPVAHLLKGRVPQETPKETPKKGLPELLAALADIRARKAELEREEREIMAATRVSLREQQEALEQLKRKVHECGIEIGGDAPAPEGSAAPAPEAQHS